MTNHLARPTTERRLLSDIRPLLHGVTFDGQALNRRTMTMAAWIANLDDFLRISEREVLTHAVSISREQADQKTELEFGKWREFEANRESHVERDFHTALEKAKQLEKKKGAKP